MDWINDRSIEIPFLLRNLKKGSILDIGSADAEYISDLFRYIPEDKYILRVDLRDIEVSDNIKEKYLISDIRKLNSRNIGKFDNVILLSTLEHMGVNEYGKEQLIGLSKEAIINSQISIFNHCKQFIDNNGRMIITIPCGQFANGGWIIVYDREMINLLKRDMKIINERYYTLNKDKTEYIEILYKDIPELSLDHKDGKTRGITICCLAMEIRNG